MSECKHKFDFIDIVGCCDYCGIDRDEYIEKLEKENAKYRAALETYVNQTHWDAQTDDLCIIIQDLLKDE